MASARMMLGPARAAGTGKRIVTLGGDITEIVYELGRGTQIAGRDATSTFPPDVEKLPNVGYFRQLGAEGVLSLRPGLILASASAGPPEVIQQLRSAGVEIVQLADGHSEAGLLDKVKRIATALDVAAEGEALAARLEREMKTAKQAVASMSGRPRVLFIINAGSGAPMAAGRETAADALIALAGAENVFSDHTGYKAISLEAAAAAAPEAIALMDQTLASMGGVDAVAAHPALRLTPAAKAKRIFARPGSYLLSFGPRLPEAMVDFARAVREKAGL
jgi:iron complex transport system substrate-binding protein